MIPSDTPHYRIVKSWIEIRIRYWRSWTTSPFEGWGNWHPVSPDTRYYFGYERRYETEADAIAAARRKMRKLQEAADEVMASPSRQYKLINVTEATAEEDVI